MTIGWYDDGSQECEDVALYLKQPESIDENKLQESKLESIEKIGSDVLHKLKSILKNTIAPNEKGLIEYD